MERRNFLQLFGGAVAGVVIAPSILSELPEPQVAQEVLNPTPYDAKWASMYEIHFSPEMWEEWYAKLLGIMEEDLGW